MSVFEKIASRIIKEQELIIGPLAWREAQKVSGIHVLDSQSGKLEVSNGDPKTVIDALVGRYDRLFGQLSHEVSRSAVAPILSGMMPAEIPLSLR